MRCPKGAWIITTHEHPIQCLDRPAPCFVDPATVVVSFGRSARRGTCSTWRERRRRVLSRLAPWRRFVGLSERRTKFGLDAGDVGMGIALSRVEREAGCRASLLLFLGGCECRGLIGGLISKLDAAPSCTFGSDRSATMLKRAVYHHAGD